MRQHTVNRRFVALLFSLIFALLALPGMAFAESAAVDGAADYVAGHIAKVTIPGGGDTYYVDLQEAVTYASDCTVTLLDDVTTTATIVVSGTVTLDLNGYGITYENDDENASVITVSSSISINASLTLQDSSPERATITINGASVTGGYITGGTGTITTSDYITGGGVYVDGASFIMTGGTICGNTLTGDSPAYGGGVYVTRAGSFEMSGNAVISGNTLNSPSSISAGAGVYLSGGSSFEMRGNAVISGNTGATNGGGVYMNGGEFTMTGGTIGGQDAGNSAKTNGGGVYVTTDATFTMSGTASVSYNSASNSGGGVYVSGGTDFTMSDTASVSYNSAETNGGGVYVDASSSYPTDFIMTGGTITGNTIKYASKDGGGVYLTTYGTFTLGNATDDVTETTIKITGNTEGSSSITGNVYLPSDKTITLADTLTADSSIGITLADDTDDFITGSTVYADVFTSDNSAYSVLISGSATSYTYTIGTAEASVTVGSGADATTTNYTTFEEAVTAANGAQTSEDAPATITLLTNVETDDTQTFDADGVYITLDLAGFDITYTGSDSGSVIAVSGGANFTLTDRTQTGDSGTVRTRYGYWEGETYTITETQPASGTTYDTITGGIITGGTGSTVSGSYTGGGGVHVTGSGSTFTMTGGTIAGNSASNYGGGVYVTGGSFNMTGGTIAGGKARYGGGVYVSGSGSFTMSGNATISGNTATSGSNVTYGGGVYVINGSFTMSGNAVISGNSASNYGGGVYVTGNSSSFTMKGDATISTNSAPYGGGVYVTESASFTMEGDAVISTNSALYGGGVSVSGTFTMAGGTISGNTVEAGVEGGGVYVGNQATFNLGADSASDIVNTKITITGNTADGADSNVFLDRPAQSTPNVTVQSTLTSGSQVGITVSDGGTPTPDNTGTFTTAGVQADGVFTADNSDYAVLTSIDSSSDPDTYTYSIGTPVVSVTVGSGADAITTYYATLAEAVDVANSASSAATIQLLAAVETETALTITNANAVITLDLNGYNITCSGTNVNALIDLYSSAQFAITGSGSITGATYGVSVKYGTYFSLSGAADISIYLSEEAYITVTGALSGAAVAVTTERELYPDGLSVPVTVAMGSGYTLTTADLAAFSTASTTAGLGLVTDENTIYLATRPTLTVALDTTSTAVAYTLSTNVSGTDYTYAITNASGVVLTTTADTFTPTETGVHSIVVIDTATGVSSVASVVAVYSATFDYADDFIVGTDPDVASAVITLPAAPSRSGYTFMGWLGGTTTYAADAEASIAADTAFTAVWKENASGATATTYYIIGLITNGYGSITPMVEGYDYVLMAQGDCTTFVFVPMDGYEIYEVYVDGVAVGALGSYTVASASANHGIYVQFAPEGTLAAEAAAGSTAQGGTTTDTTGDATDDTAADTTTGDDTADDAVQVEPEDTADDAQAEDDTEDDTTADDTVADDAATPDDDAQADADNAGGIALPALLGMAALALVAIGGSAWWFLAKKRGEDD